MDKRYFSKKVAEWYKNNKRDLPWRDSTDPYKIWLSEIILQQTRVAQGQPYYLKFIESFPTVFDLANAPEQKVLRLWQGLGYYTRARNLHKCAKVIAKNFKGLFPSTFDELKKLPGIGDYTAAAIASISFNQPAAVVDGNVYRVLSRVFGIETAINSTKGKKQFFELANELIQNQNPGVFNQAVMEFGALHCTPSNPNCKECVFQKTCVAFKNALQSSLPVKEKTKSVRKRYFYYFVLQKRNSLLMKKRTEKDIWHGLYDFYLVEKSKQHSLSNLLKDDSALKDVLKNAANLKTTGVYKHVLSHQIIFTRFILVPLNGHSVKIPPETKFYSPIKAAELPKPILIDRFLKDYQLL